MNISDLFFGATDIFNINASLRAKFRNQRDAEDDSEELLNLLVAFISANINTNLLEFFEFLNSKTLSFAELPIRLNFYLR